VYSAQARKIEHDTSRQCHKSEYLTLLNSFRVLQDLIRETAVPNPGVKSPIYPPKSFNEKELYGS
jgi:hypothetical protein